MDLSHREPAIRAAGLRRSYGSTLVVDDVDLSVERGSILGLLGPNGAGKTTIVKILSTLIRADSGEVRIAGHDAVREPAAVRAVIGVTGQFAAIDELLTPRENLRLMADLLHLRRGEAQARVSEQLDRFDLEAAADLPASTLSGGMRRKLDLAMTLIGRPEVLFLDEPTTGLDPRSRRDLWQQIRGLADSGMTILLTTQYLEEADQLADCIAVLDHGRIVAEGRPEELKRRIPGGHVRLQFDDEAGLSAAASTLTGSTVDARALTLHLPNDGTVAHVRALLDDVERQRLPVASVSVHTADLDDVFLALTGRPTTSATTGDDR